MTYRVLDEYYRCSTVRCTDFRRATEGLDGVAETTVSIFRGCSRISEPYPTGLARFHHLQGNLIDIRLESTNTGNGRPLHTRADEFSLAAVPMISSTWICIL